MVSTATPKSLPSPSPSSLDPVVSAQLESLDDSDALASAWAEALDAASAAASSSASDLNSLSQGTLRVAWGGRGRGGRGLARRTYQPHDVVVENVSLEFIHDPSVTSAGSGGSKVLLSCTTLKLLPGRVYSMVGRNGCGKSSLLRRIDAGKIPGFPPHVTTTYIPQEVFGNSMTPMDVVLHHYRSLKQRTDEAIEELEIELEALDMNIDEDQAKIEVLCERISQLEGEDDGDDASDGNGGSDLDNEQVKLKAREALRFFGIPDQLFKVPTEKLSGGMRKKVFLACALFSQPDILLLDEPTNHLDIFGILQLRRLIQSCTRSKIIVVLVSHDIDLINDVATDTIHFYNLKLSYYPGNYRHFLASRTQSITHELRQADALEKQRTAMVQTIDNLKKKAAGTKNRAGKKKIGKTIESRKKKLERHGMEKDEHGHRWTAQSAGCGIRPGSINGADAAARGKLSHRELLKLKEIQIGPVPDKAVQFDFGTLTETWGDEPLIMAMDVGHGYGGGVGAGESSTPSPSADAATAEIVKRPGMLFDCVDLCIREKSRTCILGENGCGKTTMLRLLAGVEQPLEGTIHQANGVNIGFFHQHIADELIDGVVGGSNGGGMVTALSLLSTLFPKRTEQDLRGQLTSYGLSPMQAATNVNFLSGGERCRLCMAAMMLSNPHLLILDEITNHLDVESVEALIYGIQQWNGTVVVVSHDANLIRSLGGACYVLMENEGKLRRIDGGVDTYLKAFKPLQV